MVESAEEVKKMPGLMPHPRKANGLKADKDEDLIAHVEHMAHV